jgi:hypothetical protein
MGQLIRTTLEAQHRLQRSNKMLRSQSAELLAAQPALRFFRLVLAALFFPQSECSVPKTVSKK